MSHLKFSTWYSNIANINFHSKATTNINDTSTTALTSISRTISEHLSVRSATLGSVGFRWGDCAGWQLAHELFGDVVAGEILPFGGIVNGSRNPY